MLDDGKIIINREHIRRLCLLSYTIVYKTSCRSSIVRLKADQVIPCPHTSRSGLRHTCEVTIDCNRRLIYKAKQTQSNQLERETKKIFQDVKQVQQQQERGRLTYQLSSHNTRQ